MLDFERNQPLTSSSRRVQSWLDSLYHHPSQSDEERRFSEKSSPASNNSTKSFTKSSTKNSTKNSRRSTSSASSSSFANRNARRIYLRKPRYLVRRSNRRSNPKATSNADQSSSYLSNNSSADESNLFSNLSTLNFLNDSAAPEIRADDLDFDSRNSGPTSIGSNCTSNNYSNHNHPFGILDFERWKSGLQISDELTLKVKTYAFAEKDIKIKLKGNTLVVSGKQTTEEENGFFKREFKKKFDLPYNADKKNIKYDFDMNDHLIITVPRTIHSVH